MRLLPLIFLLGIALFIPMGVTGAECTSTCTPQQAGAIQCADQDYEGVPPTPTDGPASLLELSAWSGKHREICREVEPGCYQWEIDTTLRCPGTTMCNNWAAEGFDSLSGDADANNPANLGTCACPNTRNHEYSFQYYRALDNGQCKVLDDNFAVPESNNDGWCRYTSNECTEARANCCAIELEGEGGCFASSVCPTSCTDNTQCPAGAVCTDGTCKTPVCGDDDGVCLEGCSGDPDCEPPCGPSDGTCPAGCFKNDDPDCGSCSPDTCQVGSTCIEDGASVSACKICSNGNIVNSPSGTSCNDGNSCTLQDSCQNGVCRGGANTCVCGDGDIDPGEACDEGSENGPCPASCSTSCTQNTNCPIPCQDNDGDGYNGTGTNCGPVDCNDNDFGVNPGTSEMCDDGIDNDCNGEADCQDGACSSADVCEPLSQCNDGMDNDGDGKTDYPADPGCATPDDDDEDDGSDFDGDGCSDTSDAFPWLRSPDSDGDGISDDCDNCILDSNPGQEDMDVDGTGNVCDPDACSDECDPSLYPFCEYGGGSISHMCVLGSDGCYDKANETCATDEWCDDGDGLCAETGMCGNGQTDFAEECDSGGANGACPALCSATCSSNDCGPGFCGDGVVNIDTEECDDGNADIYDSCSNQCTPCTPDQLPECPAGYTASEPGDLDGDACGEYLCVPVAVCGDGDIQPGEECDVGSATLVVQNDSEILGTAQLVFSGNGVWEGNLDLGTQIDATDSYDVEFRSDVLQLHLDPINGPLNQTVPLEISNDGSYLGSWPDRNSLSIVTLEQRWGPIDSCQAFDSFDGGNLSCNPTTCLFNTSSCQGPEIGGFCGDGMIQVGEDCDGNNWTPIDSCTNFDDFTGGVLSCGATCNFNTSNCIPPSLCGNGLIDVGETCDDGNSQSGDGCSASCQIESSYCGDGTVNNGEECDDGNGIVDDGCNNSCEIEFVCGDGLISPGEECDLGSLALTFLNASGDASGSATLELAGSAFWIGVGSMGERDDITVRVDVASLTIDVAGDEYMAEGSLIGMPDGTYEGAIDSFTAQLTFAQRWGPIDGCMDLDHFSGGNLSCNPVSCLFNTGSCTAPSSDVCGNGIIEPGEQCDGGNWGPIDSCTDFDSYSGGALSCRNDCIFDVSQCTGGQTNGTCGDGIINQGEQCDGNNWTPITSCSDFDTFTSGQLSCSATCEFNTSSCIAPSSDVCGNGIIEPGEDCEPSYFGPITECTQLDSFTGGTLSCDPVICLFDTRQCTAPQCSDGIDNDGDGWTDHPNDPQCSGADDDSEGPQCGNGIVESGEECDAGSANAATCPATCSTACTARSCDGGDGGSGGGGGGGGGGSFADDGNAHGECAQSFGPGWVYDEDLEECVKPEEEDEEEDTEPEVQIEEDLFEVSHQDSLRVDPLEKIDLSVRVENPSGTVSVSLDVPSGWSYSGPQQTAGGNVDFDIVTGEDAGEIETITVRVSGANSYSQPIRVDVSCPDFLVKAKPRLNDYEVGEDIPVYAIVCANDHREGLEVELNVNRGRQTIDMDFVNTFDLPRGSKKVYSFDVDADSVLGGGAVTTGYLREKGSTIDTDNNPIPSS